MMLMCGYILCVLLYWWLVSVAKPVVTVDQTSYEVIEGSSVTLIGMHDRLVLSDNIRDVAEKYQWRHFDYRHP